MPSAVPTSRPPLRVAILIEPTTGCEHCHDSGEVTSDELDDQGLWFKQAPCPDCHGSGYALCAADGCVEVAHSLIMVSGGRSIPCCGERTHMKQLVGQLLEGAL